MSAPIDPWGQGKLGYEEFSRVIALLAAKMQATPLQMAHALLEFTRITSDSTCTLEEAVEALNLLAARRLTIDRSLELLPRVLERIGGGAGPEEAVAVTLDVENGAADSGAR